MVDAGAGVRLVWVATLLAAGPFSLAGPEAPSPVGAGSARVPVSLLRVGCTSAPCGELEAMPAVTPLARVDKRCFVLRAPR